MRKFLFLPFLILALSTSCKKEEHNPVKTIYESQLSVKRDGKLQALTTSTSWFLPPTYLAIEAGSPELNSGYYRIIMQPGMPKGIYHQLGSNTPYVITFEFTKNYQTWYTSNDGTVQILSNDPVARRIEFLFNVDLEHVNMPSDIIELREGHIIANY
ncbi:MAG: hypothetical protein ACO1N0_03505 [Fluviicola sp.]